MSKEETWTPIGKKIGQRGGKILKPNFLRLKRKKLKNIGKKKAVGVGLAGGKKKKKKG